MNAPSRPPLIEGMTLRTAGPVLGREADLKVLFEAWDHPQTFLVCVYGFGGYGKTSLVNFWEHQLRHDAQRGVERTFIWKFRERGPGERGQPPVDEFFDAALRFFRREGPLPENLVERANLLLESLGGARTLFVLDGVDSLEAPTGVDDRSQIQEPVLTMFLERLALYNRDGLCVITTRRRPSDFDFYDVDAGNAWEDSPQVRFHCLKGIAHDAGVRLLQKHYHLEGAARDFDEAVIACEGHPLLLQWLGMTLRDFHHRQIGPWRDVLHQGGLYQGGLYQGGLYQGGGRERTPDALVQEIIRSYEHQLPDAPRAVLRLMGLFHRPVRREELEELNRRELIETDTGPSETSIVQLVNQGQPVSSAELHEALIHLRDAGVLTWFDAEGEEVYDSHSLVRTYYAQQLRDDFCLAWRQGHARLYRLLRRRAGAVIGEAQFQLLLEAAGHGCRGGFHREVWEEIYWRQLAQGHRAFRARPTGRSFPYFLDCLSHFYATPWSELSQKWRPGQELNPDQQALILEDTGHYLFLMGRLDEAIRPLEESVARRRVQLDRRPDSEIARRAAKHARLLREIHLVRGELNQAYHWANDSVQYAERIDDPAEASIEVAGLGQVLHLMGRAEEARERFAEAERARQGFLSGYPGFWHSEMLLDEIEQQALQLDPQDEAGRQSLLQRLEQAEQRVQRMFAFSDEHNFIIERALSRIALGWIAALAAALKGDGNFTRAEGHLLQALDDLREAGQQHHLVTGLILFGDTYRRMGRYERGAALLEEALRIANRCQMNRCAADAYRVLARLRLNEVDCAATPQERQAKRCEARLALNEAGARINPRAAVSVEHIEYRQCLDDVRRLDEAIGCWRWPQQDIYHGTSLCAPGNRRPGDAPTPETSESLDQSGAMEGAMNGAMNGAMDGALCETCRRIAATFG